MDCPRCGTRMEGGVCPNCGFPVIQHRRKKDMAAILRLLKRHG